MSILEQRRKTIAAGGFCQASYMMFRPTRQPSRRSVGLPVNSSHGHLVTQSCRHMVNSSPVNSSHTRLVTQSTRHKRARNKTTSTSRNYLHAVSLRRHPETVLKTDGVITAICVTLMYTADSRSRRQITLLRKARSTRHNAVKHDSQLVTRFYDVTS